MFFKILAFSDEIFNRIIIINLYHILLYYGPGIKFLGYVMRSGSDDLDPSFVSGVIGAGPRKGRKKRMVNIDYPVGVMRYEIPVRICIYLASTMKSTL